MKSLDDRDEVLEYFWLSRLFADDSRYSDGLLLGRLLGLLPGDFDLDRDRRSDNDL